MSTDILLHFDTNIENQKKLQQNWADCTRNHFSESVICTRIFFNQEKILISSGNPTNIMSESKDCWRCVSKWNDYRIEIWIQSIFALKSNRELLITRQNTEPDTRHKNHKNRLLKFLSVKYQHINIFLTCSNVPKQTYFFHIIRHYYFFRCRISLHQKKTVHNICYCVYNIIKENKYSLSMNIIFILYYIVSRFKMWKGSKYTLADNANAHAHKRQ